LAYSNSYHSLQEIYPEIDFFAAEKTLAECSLKNYIQQAWHIVEPKKVLSWNWHLDVICDHLTAVTNNYIIKSDVISKNFTHPVFPDHALPSINYLWVNMPPRHTKSLIAGVFWPTWEWGPVNLPEVKYIFASYAQELSTRDSVKRRRIIQSKWYQERWGDRFCFVGDQNQKTRFENNKTGYMIASSVGGIGTGEGGDRVLVDDAHNTKEAESETKRLACLNWWDESMSSRLNDEDSGAYIGIMQRCHQQDLSGHVIEKANLGELDNFALVCLPARYELNHPISSNSPIEFKDPRTKEDEPLDNTRYPDLKLSRIERRMTPFAKAGQMQQRPTVKGGQIFKVDNLKLIDDYYAPSAKNTIRYWDKAGSEDTGKRTAGVKMASVRHNDYDFVILDVVKGQWEAGPRERRIKQTAQLDGRSVKIYVEQEGGSGGKESAQNTIRETLKGFIAYADRPTGEKFARMDPLAAAIFNGRVAVLKRPWTAEFVEELENCGPGAMFVDQCDSASGAFNKLNVARTAGVWGSGGI
jgi:predicted phage terminase large subunit-like protein